MQPLETISAQMGNKVLGPGTHAIDIQGFESWHDATTITGATINGVVLNAAALALTHFPSGQTFPNGKLFLFASTDEVTSITVGAGLINAIRA